MLGTKWSRSTQWVARILVLAVLVTGSISYVTLNKTVFVDYDGRIAEIESMSRNVEDVLGGAAISLSEGDLVVPELSARVLDGDFISVRTVKEVDLEIDGTPQTLVTTAATVGDVLEELGPQGRNAEVSASRSDVLGRNVLKIQTMKTVEVSIDGDSFERTTILPTVRELLLDLEVVLDEGDTVSRELEDILEDGDTIAIKRAGSKGDTITETLAFDTEEREDPSLIKGEKIVVQEGKVGKSVTTYDISTLNGKESDRVVLAQSIVSKPVNEIVAIGTMDVNDPSTKILTPNEARALAKSMVLARGWDESQYTCLNSLWTKESNWRVQAANPSSSAYGIPQSLPGSKMASVGADWRTNAKTQITWGLNYISGRYGTPCGAWGHSQRVGWY